MARIEPSDFYCTECGRKGIPILRQYGQHREPGHLKKLYCIACQKEVNHAEVRDINSNYNYQDFLEEFTLGRFVDGQRYALSELMQCSNQKCHFNKNNRCWNSNYSYDCEHRPPKEEL